MNAWSSWKEEQFAMNATLVFHESAMESQFIFSYCASSVSPLVIQSSWNAHAAVPLSCSKMPRMECLLGVQTQQQLTVCTFLLLFKKKWDLKQNCPLCLLLLFVAFVVVVKMVLIFSITLKEPKASINKTE